MPNVDKYTIEETRKIIRHNERDSASFSNKDIDTSRTINNYNLIPNRGVDYLKERLKDVYIYGGANAKRKTVYTVSWICTLPQELKNAPLEKQKEFFEITTDFLKNRYGEKNAIGAYVHNDETTPHLHFVFTPVVYDEKRQREKLCSSDLMKKKELYTFHKSYQQYIYDRGLNVRIYDGQTAAAGGNRTVKEMKAERKVEEKYIW